MIFALVFPSKVNRFLFLATNPIRLTGTELKAGEEASAAESN